MGRHKKRKYSNIEIPFNVISYKNNNENVIKPTDDEIIPIYHGPIYSQRPRSGYHFIRIILINVLIIDRLYAWFWSAREIVIKRRIIYLVKTIVIPTVEYMKYRVEFRKHVKSIEFLKGVIEKWKTFAATTKYKRIVIGGHYALKWHAITVRNRSLRIKYYYRWKTFELKRWSLRYSVILSVWVPNVMYSIHCLRMNLAKTLKDGNILSENMIDKFNNAIEKYVIPFTMARMNLDEESDKIVIFLINRGFNKLMSNMLSLYGGKNNKILDIVTKIETLMLNLVSFTTVYARVFVILRNTDTFTYALWEHLDKTESCDDQDKLPLYYRCLCIYFGISYKPPNYPFMFANLARVVDKTNINVRTFGCIGCVKKYPIGDFIDKKASKYCKSCRIFNSSKSLKSSKKSLGKNYQQNCQKKIQKDLDNNYSISDLMQDMLYCDVYLDPKSYN